MGLKNHTNKCVFWIDFFVHVQQLWRHWFMSVRLMFWVSAFWIISKSPEWHILFVFYAHFFVAGDTQHDSVWCHEIRLDNEESCRASLDQIKVFIMCVSYGSERDFWHRLHHHSSSSCLKHLNLQVVQLLSLQQPLCRPELSASCSDVRLVL